MHRLRPSASALARAQTDEAIAIRRGDHFRARLNDRSIALPKYSTDVAGAEFAQRETLAWLAAWPRQPDRWGGLTSAGLRSRIERWDGEGWVEIEGSAREV